MKEELKDLHLVVLMGGPGSEREVSLRSGAAVARAFDEGGYRVTPIEVRGTEVSLPSDAGLCINMIHGTFGEDGQLQALLEARGVAYTGEGVAGSGLAFDKLASKQRFAAAVRRSGGQLVANGRIPVQAILAALDAAEAES